MAILSDLLPQSSPTANHLLLLFFCALPIIFLTRTLHSILTNPLNRIPGPWLSHYTSLRIHYLSILGTESTYLTSLHATHGPIIRISPSEILISDGSALQKIYKEKGGFAKADCYGNFDFEGVKTIFSEVNEVERGKRVRAVVGMFSSGNLMRDYGKGVLEGCAKGLVGRLRKGRRDEEGGGRVDVLDVGRRFAVDAVCGVLFGREFGGLGKGEEDGDGDGDLGASKFVDEVVEIGRFFFLPPWAFGWVVSMHAWMWPASKESSGAEEGVNCFTLPLVKKAIQLLEEEKEEGGETTYQSRLLKAGISEHETNVQMKDVVFAGTDTTAMNLAFIIWNLAKHPICYKKLQQEISAAEEKDPLYNPQNLPYLDAIIREGLRTSLANASRFPRKVPPEGWTYQSPGGKSYYLSPGTQVGMQPFTLHFNPEVFPSPNLFNPERWEQPTKEMVRDYIPFGLGPRQCIARNLAMMELVFAVRAIAREGVLDGARVVEEKVEVLEWFNSRVVGGKIEIVW